MKKFHIKLLHNIYFVKFSFTHSSGLDIDFFPNRGKGNDYYDKSKLLELFYRR